MGAQPVALSLAERSHTDAGSSHLQAHRLLGLQYKLYKHLGEHCRPSCSAQQGRAAAFAIPTEEIVHAVQSIGHTEKVCYSQRS